MRYGYRITLEFVFSPIFSVRFGVVAILIAIPVKSTINTICSAISVPHYIGFRFCLDISEIAIPILVTCAILIPVSSLIWHLFSYNFSSSFHWFRFDFFGLRVFRFRLFVGCWGFGLLDTGFIGVLIFYMLNDLCIGLDLTF